MARDAAETAVYLLTDSDGHLLYVGVSDDTNRRFGQHARSKHWWPLVAVRTVLLFPDRQSALLWEAALIEALSPQFNRTGEAHHYWKQTLHQGISLIADCLGMPS